VGHRGWEHWWAAAGRGPARQGWAAAGRGAGSVAGWANQQKSGGGRPGRCGYNGVMVRVEYVLASWKAVREDTITAVEEFPAGEFDYRPAPELATFGEIARHVAVAGDGLAGLLLAGERDFTGPEFRERMKAHVPALPQNAGAAELAAALRETIDRRAAQFAEQPVDFWAAMIRRVDGQEVTRLEMVQWMKEHELTHRQQLFMYMRMKGMVPATTRRRLARLAGK